MEGFSWAGRLGEAEGVWPEGFQNHCWSASLSRIPTLLPRRATVSTRQGLSLGMIREQVH